MAKYILKKDGYLYNKETGKSIKGSRKHNLPICLFAPYYALKDKNGKTCNLRCYPYDMITLYNLNDFNIEVEDGVTPELFAELYTRWHFESVLSEYEKSQKTEKDKGNVRYRVSSFWIREISKTGLISKEEYLRIWEGIRDGKEPYILRSDFK